MKNPRLCIGLPILLLQLPLAVWLDPANILIGVLRNETFYRGRPTSYWKNVIDDAGHRFMHRHSGDPVTDVKDFLALNPNYPTDYNILHSGDPGAIVVGIEFLSDKHFRMTGISVLEAIGPLARQNRMAVALLLNVALHDEDYWVREYARRAVKHIDPEKAADFGIRDRQW